MNLLPAHPHGAVDYVIGALLVALPFVFDFADGGVAQWLPMLIGFAALEYSLLTDYGSRLVALLSLPIHAALALPDGILLTAFPWFLDLSVASAIPT